MKPEFISYPVHISSYSVFLLLGFFFGYLLARQRAVSHDLRTRHIDNLAFLSLVAGSLGAWIFSRIFGMHLDLWDALNAPNRGGIAFYGGFITSILAVVIYASAARISLLTLCDVAA